MEWELTHDKNFYENLEITFVFSDSVLTWGSEGLYNNIKLLLIVLVVK